MTSFFSRNKSLILNSVLGVGFSALFISTCSNYTLGKGGASATCLHARVFLIDHSDTSLRYNQLVAFTQTKELTFMPESIGETWVKILVGQPGDTVRVTLDGVTVHTVDGAINEYPLNARRVIASLDWSEEVEREWHLENGQLFVIGETESSFDSRFWGPTQVDNVQGASYALF